MQSLSNTESTYKSNGLVESASDIPIWHLFGVAIVFVAAFWNLVSLDSDKDEIALDFQVYIKLLSIGGAGLYGIIGFLTEPRVRKAAITFPAAWILMIFFVYAAASLKSVTPATALASTMSILFIYLMTITAAFELGKELLVKILFWAVSTFVVGSWIVYFALPEIGIMEEPLAEGEFAVRMSGLAHPNTLGQHAAFCVILGLGLWFGYLKRNFLILVMVGLAVGALVLCLSRASMAAVMFAIALGGRHVILGKNPRMRFFQLAIAGVLCFLVFSTLVDVPNYFDEKMGAVSKSGDSDEITTATGRSEIWEKSIQLIQAKPVLGYGPTTSKFLLEDYSMYTHNLLLNIGLSSGVFGLMVGLVMCLSRIWGMFYHRNFVADALVGFVLLNGLFENVIFSNLCGIPTICWILGLGWFQFDDNDSTGASHL